MNILYVCHRVPYPPRRGGKIRPFNMISHFSKKHDVTVASLARSEVELEESAGLRDHCREVICERVTPIGAFSRMLARAPTTIPFSMGYFLSPALHRRVNDALSRTHFDLIFVHCSSVAQYVSEVTGIPKILDFGDMDSQKWLKYGDVRAFPMSWLYKLEGIKLEAAEKRLARLFDMNTCTTQEELATLRSFDTGVPSDWFPNGVDTDYFAPAKGYDPDLISFVGRMDYYPNQEAMIRFCKATLPLIQRRRSGAKLVIVGANPSAEIRRLSSLPGVTVTGSVPDVRPFVTRSAVNVAPLAIARGTQNKILEAMAMGVPVVTSEAAARGVDAEPSEHFLCADTPQALAEAVLSLLENAAERRRFAVSGRQRVLDHHDWRSSMRRLDAIVEQCMATYAESDRFRRGPRVSAATTR
jgi:sugar transferase (PEP-CTERM/EpsH1 system associated)